MWIINLTANPNGSHNDHRADHITTVPDGWAMIPDDFKLPASYPFGEITAEELTYTREVEVQKKVIKTLDTGMVDGDGNPIMEDYTEMETVKETQEYTMMTVTAMSEGVVPPAAEPEPTEEEKRDAQIFYTAMMTDTLLEEV